MPDAITFTSTLESEVLAADWGMGTVGVAFSYRVGGLLPLKLQVRVLTDDDVVLPHAPYSLVFSSTCCNYILYDDDDGPPICGKCENVQAWAPVGDETLHLLGSGVTQALECLREAISSLFGLNPLTAMLAAHGVIEDIERVHSKHLTETWAHELAGVDRHEPSHKSIL